MEKRTLLSILALFFVFTIINMTPACAVRLSEMDNTLDKVYDDTYNVNEILNGNSVLNEIKTIYDEKGSGSVAWYLIWNPQKANDALGEILELNRLLDTTKTKIESSQNEELNLSSLTEIKDPSENINDVQKKLSERNITTNQSESTIYHLKENETIQFNNSNGHLKYWGFTKYNFNEKKDEWFIELFSGKDLQEMDEKEALKKITGKKLSSNDTASNVTVKEIYSMKEAPLREAIDWANKQYGFANTWNFIGDALNVFSIILAAIGLVCGLLSWIPFIGEVAIVVAGVLEIAAFIIANALVEICRKISQYFKNKGDSVVNDIKEEYKDLVDYVR